MTRELTEITVVGGDKTGLIARVTSLLFERGINIEDLDQAVREGVFRMTTRVDTAEMETSRGELRRALAELGRELDVDIQVRFPSDRDARRVALLVTKETHAPEALLEAEERGELADDGEAEIPVVIGNRGDLRSLAERYDKPFYDVGDGNGNTDEGRLLDLLAEYDVDLIALARYMRILSPEVVFRYEGRIINVHPSLLPAFPGAEAYRQAKDAGVRIAGVTAHYVTTDLDQGPVIAQRAFDVPPGAEVNEIKRRGQPLEAEVLLDAVRLHLADAIAVHRGTVHVREDVDVDAQLGLSDAAVNANPDEPVDGEPLGRSPPSPSDD
ncbi:ACT domain-containing protein [Halorubrum sp. SD690R]|uniref:formyltetrahydrofolate deformylase n=1 Tax=unclassified Halorubrum TaxID=2642239 RepID=UPI000A2D33C4|nr:MULTISPECIES: formyltransferase family protein [unclassified Halorubrum]OTF09234.1 formyltetrahydrofolate deformylase [Halorubrum sp. SD612]TKX47951.1 ACT domain-containing protein [Halorubrum sp. SD690R]